MTNDETRTRDMSMRDGEDAAFGQRIHDAYESVELSPDAEARILDKLLAAQAERRVEEPTEPAAAAEAPAAAEVLPLPRTRKRSLAQIALPLAACLALIAIIGGRALFPDSPAASDAGGAPMEEKAADKPLTFESAQAPEADAAAAAPEIRDAEIEFDNGVKVRLVRVSDEEYPAPQEDGVLYEVPAKFADERLGEGTLVNGGAAVLYSFDDADVWLGLVKGGGYYIVYLEAADAYYLAESVEG